MASERVYITANGCEIAFGEPRGLISNFACGQQRRRLLICGGLRMSCEAPWWEHISSCIHHGTMFKNRSAVIATSAVLDFETTQESLNLWPDIAGVYYFERLNVKRNNLGNLLRM